MARTLRRAEYWGATTVVGVVREQTGTHGDTTCDVAAAAAATSIGVAATTNFTDGDPVLIDSAELLEFNQLSGTIADPLLLKYPLAKAHAVGVTVVEAARTVLGDISDAGVRGGVTQGDFNAVGAATKRLVEAYLLGHVQMGYEFELENWNPQNICMALGIPESKITGAGTSASPWRIVAIADDFNTEADQVLYFTGALKGGGIVEVQAWGLELDPSAFTQTYTRGPSGNIPVRARAVSAISFETY